MVPMPSLSFCLEMLNILEKKLIEFDHLLCIIDFEKIIGLEYVSFSQLCNRVVSFDYCQKVISAQYLVNKWIKFTNFVYALMLTRFRLGLLHIVFRKFLTELRTLINIRYQKFFSG